MIFTHLCGSISCISAQQQYSIDAVMKHILSQLSVVAISITV